MSGQGLCPAQEGKRWHELALNVAWESKGLHGASCYCFHCGKHFECKEFIVKKEEGK